MVAVSTQCFEINQKWIIWFSSKILWKKRLLYTTRCLKITEKVSFNIASEASYVYILSGQKLIKNVKNGPFWRVFENLKLAVKQCYQTGQILVEYANAIFWVIFKDCDTVRKYFISVWELAVVNTFFFFFFAVRVDFRAIYEVCMYWAI